MSSLRRLAAPALAACVAFACLATHSARAAERASVSVVNGNIVLTAAGKEVQLTSSGQDLDPVLSPNGSLVVFTRKLSTPATKTCDTTVTERRELWVIGSDKSNPRKLLASRDSVDPKNTLCDFMHKAFNSDGRKVLFETPAWATSSALHEYDLTTNRQRYLLPSNGFAILKDCDTREYRDHLVVSQHRYFVFGGSYDWYWLYSPDGKRELGAIGDDLTQLEDACDLDLGLAAAKSK
ncbi:MAG: hypothetical protein GC190_21585 [Alphaproteobacteria bacterium]|nr:hypothetical protein [Alphaproteobacteria bacterium]